MKKVDLITIKSNNKSNTKLRVFETFAGIGAQHKAITNLNKKEKTNFEIIGVSEWYIDAILAYRKIHYNSSIVKKVNFCDFTNLTFSTDSKRPLDKKNLKEKKDRYVKDLYVASSLIKNYGSISEIKGDDIAALKIDILTYSFPCQDLSTAGFFWNKSNGMDKKSKTRSSLVWEVGRIVEELKKTNSQPKILIMENVKSIINKKHKSGFDKWQKYLSNLGYKTIYKILNGLDFGIPQRRERIIAISHLENINFTEEMWNEYEEQYKKKYVKKINLNDLLRKDYSNDKILQEAKIQTPNNTPSRKIMYKKCKNLNESNYCWTISTKQDRFPNAGIIHFSDNEKKFFANSDFRFLTPRECFLLMGFSDKDYERVRNLELPFAKELLLAGNSIIVNVMESVFYTVAKVLGDT